jgi:hypothetical protein
VIIVARESPGFATSRMGTMIGRELCRRAFSPGDGDARQLIETIADAEREPVGR